MPKQTAKDLIRSFSPSQFTDGVYVHSTAKNADFYDLLWEYQSSEDHTGGWGNNRIPKFLQFIGGYKYWPKGSPIVLDMACGLGRFSIACLELGAKYVVACDGSFVGPKYISDLIISTQIPNNQFGNERGNIELANSPYSEENILPIQVDIEQISECFSPGKFDFVFIHMALHHVRDFKETLSDLAALLNDNGTLATNFFTPGTTPVITHVLRDIFLNEPIKKVRNFLISINRIEISGKHHEEFDFEDYLFNPRIASDYQEYREKLQHLKDRFSLAQIYDHLRWEDMQTPYLHNLDHDEVSSFIQSDLGLRIINQSKGRIIASKQQAGLLKRIFF